MDLKEGDRVKLRPIEEINPEDPPGVDGEMEDFFGTTVTVRRQLDGRDFFIEEDEEFRYSVHWIDARIKTSQIPIRLKRMV